MGWFPTDKKSVLYKECQQRGLPVTKDDLKQHLVNLLTADDLAKETDTETSLTFPVSEASWDTAHKSDPEPPQAPVAPPTIPESMRPLKPAPVPPRAPKETSRVLDYLVVAAGRVSLQKLLKDCGENALTEVKKLVSEHKIMQFRQHNKFWFQARYR